MNKERFFSPIPAGFGEQSLSDSNVSNSVGAPAAAIRIQVDATKKPRELDPDILQSSRFLENLVNVQITHSSMESDIERVSIHSNGSIPRKHIIFSKATDSNSRRHSLPAIALDKVKSLLNNKNSLSLTPPLENEESMISRRKKSIIGLFNTIGTNLGLVTPKRSLSNIVLGPFHGSNGSIDLIRLRHSLELLEMDPTLKNMTSMPITSIDDIYYRPHRSFVRDILCCICFKKHDEYDNLIESHSCARIFTALVLLTIFCMLVGYIIKAAGETK